MATEGQITYLMTLMQRAGCSVNKVGAEHVKLGASRQHRNGSVRDWLADMNVRQTTTLAETLHRMIDEQHKR